MEANPQLTRKYRFSSTSATITSITAAKLLNSCGVVASTTTVGNNIFGAAKVLSVKAWTPPASQGSNATVSILWASAGANYTSGLEVMDSTNSVSVPATIRSRPPQNTLASFFQTNSGSATLFTLTCPVGTIIDVTVRLVMNDALTVDAAPGTCVLAGATVGSVYYTPLDGHGGIYTPLGLTLG